VIWPAHYYDGKTSERHDVSVDVRGDGLALMPANTVWPYAEITQTQGFFPGDLVRLERSGTGEALIVPNRAFLIDANQYAPHLRQEVPDGQAKLALTGVVAGLIVAAIAAIVLIYFAAPYLERTVVAMIPASVEERIGQIAVSTLSPASERCDNPALTSAVQRISTRIAEAAGEPPERFQVFVSKRPEVNAFALPGGYIVICSGLLEKTTRAEELAGVLAHEMQHVIQQHSMRAMVRQIGWSTAISVIAGDSAALATALQLGSLSYQRGDEESADREGMRVLQAARIDPNGMIAMFRVLEAQSPDLAGPLSYLSTHPSIDSRIERLIQMSQERSISPVPILPATDWRAIASTCH
jgi:Zn-dependent protease with chaperone function